MRNILSRITFLARGRRVLSQGPLALLGIDLPIRTSWNLTAEAHADIAERLASMPLFVRETYLLRAVDRMSIDEISNRLGISRRRARRYLREAIAILAATGRS